MALKLKPAMTSRDPMRPHEKPYFCQESSPDPFLLKHILSRLTLCALALMNGCSPFPPIASQRNELGRALPRAGPLGPKGYEARSSRQPIGSHGETIIDFTNLRLHGPLHPYTLELRFYSTLQAHSCVVTNPENYTVALL